MGEKEEKSINIGGSAINASINTGNIKNSNIQINAGDLNVSTIRTIGVDKMILEKMPKEYAASLQKFIEDLNCDIEKTSIPQKEMEQLQTSTTEVAKEMTDVMPEKGVPLMKKHRIATKLIDLAKNLVKASPSIAEKVASMTPLAPFSKLIGESFEKIVAEVLKEFPTRNKTS